MLISSSRCSLLTNYYNLKGAYPSNKVALQRNQIRFQEERLHSIMEGRVKYIQNELMDLNDSMELFNCLARIHYAVFYRLDTIPQNETFKCRDAAYAMIQRNLFDHRFYREIENLADFEDELKGKEEGTFLVRVVGKSAFALKNQFQGHAFIICKIQVENKTTYLIAQSFAGKYSLKSFISKHRMIYDSYDQLDEEILDPLKIILDRKDAWTIKECQALRGLTGIFSEGLIGFAQPTYAEFGRSSNIAIDGKKMLTLGNFVEGRLLMPDEWRGIVEPRE